MRNNNFGQNFGFCSKYATYTALALIGGSISFVFIPKLAALIASQKIALSMAAVVKPTLDATATWTIMHTPVILANIINLATAKLAYIFTIISKLAVTFYNNHIVLPGQIITFAVKINADLLSTIAIGCTALILLFNTVALVAASGLHGIQRLSNIFNTNNNNNNNNNKMDDNNIRADSADTASPSPQHL